MQRRRKNVKNCKIDKSKSMRQRLMEISFSLDDYLYKNRRITVSEAEMYISEVTGYKELCSDERSYQVIEKVLHCMNNIINEHSLPTNNDIKRCPTSTISSIDDLTQCTIDDITEPRTEAIECIDMCENENFQVVVDIERAVSILSICDKEAQKDEDACSLSILDNIEPLIVEDNEVTNGNKGESQRDLKQNNTPITERISQKIQTNLFLKSNMQNSTNNTINNFFIGEARKDEDACSLSILDNIEPGHFEANDITDTNKFEGDRVLKRNIAAITERNIKKTQSNLILKTNTQNSTSSTRVVNFAQHPVVHFTRGLMKPKPRKTESVVEPIIKKSIKTAYGKNKRSRKPRQKTQAVPKIEEKALAKKDISYYSQTHTTSFTQSVTNTKQVLPFQTQTNKEMANIGVKKANNKIFKMEKAPIALNSQENDFSWFKNVKLVREVCHDEYELCNVEECFWDNLDLPGEWDPEDFNI